MGMRVSLRLSYFLLLGFFLFYGVTAKGFTLRFADGSQSATALLPIANALARLHFAKQRAAALSEKTSRLLQVDYLLPEDQFAVLLSASVPRLVVAKKMDVWVSIQGLVHKVRREEWMLTYESSSSSATSLLVPWIGRDYDLWMLREVTSLWQAKLEQAMAFYQREESEGEIILLPRVTRRPSSEAADFPYSLSLLDETLSLIADEATESSSTLETHLVRLDSQDFPFKYYLLAQGWGRLHRPQKALENALIHYQQHSNTAALVLYLQFLSLSDQKAVKALWEKDSATVSQSVFASVEYAFAKWLVSIGERESARVHFVKAASILPSFVYLQAAARHTEGTTALSYWRAAGAFAPKNTEIQAHIARLSFELGDMDGAISALRIAVSDGYFHPKLSMALGVLLIRKSEKTGDALTRTQGVELLRMVLSTSFETKEIQSILSALSESVTPIIPTFPPFTGWSPLSVRWALLRQPDKAPQTRVVSVSGTSIYPKVEEIKVFVAPEEMEEGILGLGVTGNATKTSAGRHP